MEIGKVPNDLLKKIILNKIHNKRDEILVRPKIGEDCCVVDFGDYDCIMSTDPITGAVNEIGRLAVHISCNDIASCGVEPIGLLIAILAPPNTTENELESVMEQISETAALINVDIIGGHTEITNAVNRFVITSTAIGRVSKNKYVTTSGANSGDSVVVTKSIGIEGTAIIAHDKETELSGIISQDELIKAKSFINNISVVKDGVFAGEFGVTSMHDVTEGGILGALWEMSDASGVGVKVYRKNMPVEEITLKLCKHYNIDPLKLISSGCMLITCKDGQGLIKHLNSKGIKATIIGAVTEDIKKILIDENVEKEIPEPQSDELYKVL